MQDHESSNESNHESTQADRAAADRRSFMKTAVKTVVAGAAVAGIAGSVGKAEAATTCGGTLTAPKAVVRANVMFNAQKPPARQDIINLVNALFDGSVCPNCGLGGFPGSIDPGTIVQITIGNGFLGDSPSNVIFTEAGGF